MEDSAQFAVSAQFHKDELREGDADQIKGLHHLRRAHSAFSKKRFPISPLSLSPRADYGKGQSVVLPLVAVPLLTICAAQCKQRSQSRAGFDSFLPLQIIATIAMSSSPTTPRPVSLAYSPSPQQSLTLGNSEKGPQLGEKSSHERQRLLLLFAPPLAPSQTAH